MVTSLDNKTCKLIGMEHWTHERVSAYLGDQVKNKTIAFIPNASLTVKKNERA
jgi:peptidase E